MRTVIQSHARSRKTTSCLLVPFLDSFVIASDQHVADVMCQSIDGAFQRSLREGSLVRWLFG